MINRSKSIIVLSPNPGAYLLKQMMLPLGEAATGSAGTSWSRRRLLFDSLRGRALLERAIDAWQMVSWKGYAEVSGDAGFFASQ